jgi:hypothetical protein
MTKRASLVTVLAVVIVTGLLSHAAAQAPVPGVQPVVNGCPPLPAPPGFTHAYVGGAFVLPDITPLAVADFFTAATGGAFGPGVCTTSAGGTSYWFALPADPIRTAYSGAGGVIFGAVVQWDELVIQDAAGGLYDITPAAIPPFGTPGTSRSHLLAVCQEYGQHASPRPSGSSGPTLADPRQSAGAAPLVLPSDAPCPCPAYPSPHSRLLHP